MESQVSWLNQTDFQSKFIFCIIWYYIYDIKIYYYFNNNWMLSSDPFRFTSNRVMTMHNVQRSDHLNMMIVLSIAKICQRSIPSLRWNTSYVWMIDYHRTKSSMWDRKIALCITQTLNLTLSTTEQLFESVSLVLNVWFRLHERNIF